MNNNVLYLSVIFSLFVFTNALFEDQIGKFDWRQQFIGKISDVYWDQSFMAGKRLLVTSELNSVGAIHTLNGSLAWRKVLEQNDRGTVDVSLHEGDLFVTLNGGGRFLRRWNPGTGNLIWESVVGSSAQSGSAIMLHDKDLLIVLTAGGIQGLEARNGKQKWHFALPQSEKSGLSFLAKNERTLYAVEGSHGSHVTVVTLDVEGGKKSQRIASTAWMQENTRCKVASGTFLLCYSPQGSLLHWLDLMDGQSFKAIELGDLVKADSVSPSQVQIEEMKSSKQPVGEVLLRVAINHVAVIRVTKQGILVVKDLPGVSAAQISHIEERKILLTLLRDNIELVFEGYDMNTETKVPELSQRIHYLKHHGFPIKMETLLFKKRDLTIGFKMAIISEDYSMQLVQKTDKIAWRREESLAYILSVEMFDLPVSENQAKFEDEFGSHKDDVATMFMKRFQTQFSQLKTFIMQQIQKLQGHRHHHHETDIMAEETDDDEELMRDEFNLNKLIVLVTASGKIFGLRSTNGHIEWEYFIPELSPFTRYGKQKMLLFVQRTTAHFPHPPQCAVIGKHKENGHGLIFAFNPINGEPVQSPGAQTLGYKLLQATLIGEMDDNFLRGVLLMDTDNKLHTYPPSCSYLVRDRASSLFMFLADVETGLINGFRTLPSKGELTAEKVWTVNLQKKQQTITNIVAKRPLEHVHSQGRVLGDRSVLYKYLNPNLVVIIAEGEMHDSTISQKGPVNFFNVFLMDSVTGHMVFHASHKRARGPVSVIHSENWVIYSFFSQKSRRNEMAVLELFEGKDQNNATAFSSFSAPKQPLVLRQSYIMPLYTSTMATTVTEKGITSKQLIFALEYGGLLSLPKALLDPRRPMIPSQETMEEGTVPYIPELPVHAEAIINYNQSLYNIKGIHTSPAGLESTSLVLAYGIDLYFTRVTPSKMFDVLKEDFDYLFISAVLIGMFLMTFVTQKLSARKALNRAWK